MPAPPVPTLLALLLCDTAIVDAQTTKKSLIGIFGQLTAPAFPTQLNLAVFARLTDAEGKYKFKVDVVNLDEDKPVAGFPANELEVKDQLGFVELILQIQGFVVPSPGKYEFQLWGNDVYLGRTTMQAALLKLGA